MREKEDITTCVAVVLSVVGGEYGQLCNFKTRINRGTSSRFAWIRTFKTLESETRLSRVLLEVKAARRAVHKAKEPGDIG